MKRRNLSKIILVSLPLLLVLGGTFYFITRDHRASTPPSTPGETINYDPPTKEESLAGDAQKKINEQAEEAYTNKKTIALTISDARQYGDTIEIRAFSTDITQDNGTCTTTLTKNSQVITRATSAFMDASSTQCGAIDIPASEIPSGGSWNVQVKYLSQTHSGVSDNKQVMVTK